MRIRIVFGYTWEAPVANGKWKGLEPEYVLLGCIVRQAMWDAKQTSDKKLRREAWQFLETVAPTVAERLRNQQAQSTGGATVTNYKQHERKTAALLGGKRNIDSKGSAAADVNHDFLSVECKTRKEVPQWLLGAMQQARRAAQAGQLPIVVLHPHGGLYANDLVIMRLSDFVDWFGANGGDNG
jgi:hypothetical protein